MSDDLFTDDAANAEARMRQSAGGVRWIADQTPGPFIAYFTVHGEGWIVTDRERPAQTRIATVSTDPDDYGRANTLMIADALNRATAEPADV